MSKKILPGVNGPGDALRPDLDRVLDSRAAVREWLVDGGSPSAVNAQGDPAWAVTLAHAPADAVDELINAGADLNARTRNGQGWLLRCLDAGAEPWLVLAGFRRLDRTWWEPDHEGRSPFFDARQTAAVAQAMGTRWWTEGRSWTVLARDGQTPAAHAQEAHREDLMRVWRLWSSRSLFAGRRADVHRA